MCTGMINLKRPGRFGLTLQILDPADALGRGYLKLSPIHRENLALRTYLGRRSRNEFINFASQIGYGDKNVTLVFYKNQICKFMD